MEEFVDALFIHLLNLLSTEKFQLKFVLCLRSWQCNDFPSPIVQSFFDRGTALNLAKKLEKKSNRPMLSIFKHGIVVY